MAQVTAEEIQHMHYRDPHSTPYEITVGEHLHIGKGKEVKNGENEGIVTGFYHDPHRNLDDHYEVEVVWIKGPLTSSPETQYQKIDIIRFLAFFGLELIES